MNKKLMAVAVAGAFFAPAAALAQNATVQLYGKATVEYGYADQGAGRPSSDVFQTPGGSAVGVKGEEKLGGGMSAWFQCESSADVRGINGDGFCTRNSAIGLKGSWGNLHFGRWDTPFKRAMVGMVGAGDTGLFGAAFLMAGNSTGTIASGGGGFSVNLGRNIWKRRESSLIYYESPSFSGFEVLAAYSAANATRATDFTTGAKPRVMSIAGTYNNGPLSVGLAYEKHSDFGGVGGGNDDRGWNIGAAYTFAGKVKVGAQYIDTKYETSATTDAKKKNWMVGVEWNISGPHNLDAAYVVAGDTKGSATAADVAAAGINAGNGPITVNALGSGAKLYQIAYRHTLSKRTWFKVGYVRVDNDGNSVGGASYSLGGLRAPALMGETQSAWAMYAEHKF